MFLKYRSINPNCAVDETGGQIAVFGRLGSRPFNRSEMERLFLTPGGLLDRVRDRDEAMAGWLGLLAQPPGR